MAATELEKDQYENAKNPEYNTNSFINDAFALIDEFENEDILKTSSLFQTGKRMKISVAAVSKYINNLDKKELQKNVMWFDYNVNVEKIVLNDSLNDIGINGHMDIHNIGSYADLILHRHNAFYIIINITMIETTEKGNTTIKLEPYIFEISKVENLSSPDSEDKRLRIHLMDLMTAICYNHSIATVIKLTKSEIVKRTSYKEVFKDILDYIKSHLKVNMLGKYDYRKDLYFTDEMKLQEKFRKKNQDDEDSGGNEDMSQLIKASFAKMAQDATIMDAIHILQRDCGRVLKTPIKFSSVNQTAGDLIIPFYFKEEYQSLVPYYYQTWYEEGNGKEDEKRKKAIEEGASAVKNFFTLNWSEGAKNTKNVFNNISSQKMIDNDNYGGKESMILYRNMTMRDIYMPFFMAFSEKSGSSSENWNFIFESMNPEVDEKGKFTKNELAFQTAYGYRRNVIIHQLQSFPYDVSNVKKRWKNIVFVDIQNQTSSVLIFLRWFYNYFCTVFLNDSTVGDYKYVPNLLPSFLAKSLANKVGEAKTEGETFDSLYDTHNSNIFVCRTTDSRNEALREMGKNIASFILSNNRFVMRVDGDIFRRPNEIIKFSQFTGKNSIFSELNSMITAGLNLSGDPYTLMYVTSVSHVFQGTEYVNYIEGSKFCENLNYKIKIPNTRDSKESLDGTISKTKATIK